MAPCRDEDFGQRHFLLRDADGFLLDVIERIRPSTAFLRVLAAHRRASPMTPPRYTIGEFSRLSRLTVTTLRHYDEIGLLPPAEVDRATGYRYYDAEQLPARAPARRPPLDGCAPRRPPRARPEPADPGGGVGAPTPEGRGRAGRAGATPRPPRRAGPRSGRRAGRRGGRAPAPDRRRPGPDGQLGRGGAGDPSRAGPPAGAAAPAGDRAVTPHGGALPGRPRGRAHGRGLHGGRHLHRSRRRRAARRCGRAHRPRRQPGAAPLRLPSAARGRGRRACSSPAGRSARSTTTRRAGRRAPSCRSWSPPAARRRQVSASGRCASDRRAPGAGPRPRRAR